MNRCFDDLNSAEIATIAQIAHYSGGSYTLTIDGGTLLTLPLRYDTSAVYTEFRTVENCKGKQTYYFPVSLSSNFLHSKKIL
jgi:hypothetical protein